MQFSVFFENPFWVGVFERVDERGYSVSRVVFGSDPRDREVWELLLANLRQVRFSDPIPEPPKSMEVQKNPKRVQREAREALERAPLSTKAQDALRLALEQKKKVKKEQSKAAREAERDRLFTLKQEKRKEKKRGH
ncbi:MAG TPA: YjdF family protein [Polyangiaceae bacterium]|nr:YjdF family protein [Polyangiaceae bacterium]